MTTIAKIKGCYCIVEIYCRSNFFFFVGGAGGGGGGGGWWGNQNLNVLEMLVYVTLDSVSKMVTVRVTQFLQ